MENDVVANANERGMRGEDPVGFGIMENAPSPMTYMQFLSMALPSLHCLMDLLPTYDNALENRMSHLSLLLKQLESDHCRICELCREFLCQYDRLCHHISPGVGRDIVSPIHA